MDTEKDVWRHSNLVNLDQHTKLHNGRKNWSPIKKPGKNPPPRTRARIARRPPRSSVRARAPVQLLLTAPSSSHPSLPPSFFKEVSRDKERSGASPHLPSDINQCSELSPTGLLLPLDRGSHLQERDANIFPGGPLPTSAQFVTKVPPDGFPLGVRLRFALLAAGVQVRR